MLCGGCKKACAPEVSMQLIPCLHTICNGCFHDRRKKGEKVCPVKHCYSQLKLWSDIKWNTCENETCVRKCSQNGEEYRTPCMHSLCSQCLDDANRSDQPLCPVIGCNAALTDEEDKEQCAGPCKNNIDSVKLITMSCCKARICTTCLEKWSGGKDTCPPGKCDQLKTNKEKDKPKRKGKPIVKTPCAGQIDCDGEVLKNFPSDGECEHEVCLTCLAKMLDECEANNSVPICPAEGCRLPYRIETVLALRAHFSERNQFFDQFDLGSHYSIAALKDDTVMHVNGIFKEPKALEIKVCFMEDEENVQTVEFSQDDTLGDLLREVRRVLRIMPTDKVYGYFRRDGDKEKQMQVKDKRIFQSIDGLHITRRTQILVDVTGIVGSKAKQGNSRYLSLKENKETSGSKQLMSMEKH